jgi:hypothetical protein
MKKKVFIICDLFPPAFAPRMGYLCKYLVKAGWEPVVLTEEIPGGTFAHLSGICETHTLSYYSRKKGIPARIRRMVFLLLDLFLNYKERCIYRKAIGIVRSNNFNLMLCSTYRTFPLMAAARISRRFNLPWIADLRDIVEQCAGNEFISRPLPPLLASIIAPIYAKASISARNRAIRQANHVTTVSEWHVDLLSAINPSTSLVCNGFDPEIFYPKHTASRQFVIVHTGRIQSIAMRDPALLFQAIEILYKEGSISPNDFRLHWYVDQPSWTIVETEASRYGIGIFMDYKGMTPAYTVPAILNRSSILLLLANRACESGPKGIMTTKLFEYLAVERPILCVRSDESFLADIIHDAKAGISAVNVEEVCDFLLIHYNYWKENHSTLIHPNRETIDTFSRKRQADMFMDLFLATGRE